MSDATHSATHDHGHGHGEHMAHVASVPSLVGTFACLIVLTIITVGVTTWDFGPNVNLLVAMIIATMKATLVCLFFMHLLHDKGFHSVVFLSSLVFVLLFVTFAMMDSFQYRPAVDAFRDAAVGQP